MAVRLMDGDAVMHALLGRTLAVAGDRAAALSVAESIAREDPGYGRYAYEIALIHLALGDADRALELLLRARDRRSGWLVYAHVDPRLDSLRTIPRFTALLPVRRP
jgi:tetratricopeptide (TPR) repeat protein